MFNLSLETNRNDYHYSVLTKLDRSVSFLVHSGLKIVIATSLKIGFDLHFYLAFPLYLEKLKKKTNRQNLTAGPRNY